MAEPNLNPEPRSLGRRNVNNRRKRKCTVDFAPPDAAALEQALAAVLRGDDPTPSDEARPKLLRTLALVQRALDYVEATRELAPRAIAEIAELKRRKAEDLARFAEKIATDASCEEIG